jgi:hypothetical protein
LIGLSTGYVLLQFHAFLKLFGSARRLIHTINAAAYPLSLTFLVVAVLVRLKIGNTYAMFTFDVYPIPSWQSAVDISLGIWLLLIFIVIQAQVHSLKWYKVFACYVLIAPVLVGWQSFLTALFMSPF